MHIRNLAPFLLLLAVPAFSQQGPQLPIAANTPVGQWMAEHPTTGGIGSWWDFRPDGTFTMHFGAMVTMPVTHTANTLTMPASTTNGKPVPIEYHVEPKKLLLKTPGAPGATFTREGDALSASDLLLGRWRPDPPAVANPDPQAAAMDTARSNGHWVFFADGTLSLRIPFGSRTGTWDAAAHTFKFNEEPTVYSFNHSGTKLVLGQPPSNQTTDTYLPDPIP